MRSNSTDFVLALGLLATGCAANGGGNPSITGQSSRANTDAVPAGPESDAAGLADGGSATDASDGALSEPPSRPDDAHVPLESEPSAAQALIGHYAMRQRSATVASALGTTHKSLTTSYMLVDIFERDGEVWWRQRGCRSQIVNDPASTEVSISDLVPRTTAALESKFLARRRGDAIDWERPTASAALGFHDDDPEREVPADRNDPRVYDQDGDEKPGITVHIRTQVLLRTIEGDTYNTQRLQSRLSGSFDGGRMAGQVFETTETKVLQATNAALAFELKPVRDANGDNSVLLMKVDEGMSCDELVQRAYRIF